MHWKTGLKVISVSTVISPMHYLQKNLRCGLLRFTYCVTDMLMHCWCSRHSQPSHWILSCSIRHNCEHTRHRYSTLARFCWRGMLRSHKSQQWQCKLSDSVRYLYSEATSTRDLLIQRSMGGARGVAGGAAASGCLCPCPPTSCSRKMLVLLKCPVVVNDTTSLRDKNVCR